jgi:hypothetical protein
MVATESDSSVFAAYIARPHLALDRLEEHGDGCLRYRLKKVS